MYVFDSVCTFFLKTLPSGSPLRVTVQVGHRLQAHHKIRCRRDPGHGKTRTQYPVSVSIIHLFKSTLQVLYIRRMSSEYLRALQTSWWGWADSKAVHSMECRGGHARSTGGLSLSRGCCLRCTVLPALGGVLPQARTNSQRTKQQTLPPYAWVVFITGDTLRHQPMGAGHMTVFQFRGPITYCVLQWCHPMLTGT